MNRYLLFVTLLWSCVLPVETVRAQASHVETKTISATFEITPDATLNQFTVRDLRPGIDQWVTIQSIDYTSGALVVDVSVVLPGKSQEVRYEGISADIKLTRLANAAEAVRKTIEATAQELWQEDRRAENILHIQWPGIAERMRPLDGRYEIELDVHISGSFTRYRKGSKPALDKEKLTLQYIAGGLGLTALVTSWPLQRSADRKYDEYLTAVTESAATPLYDEANRRRNTYQVTRLVGVVLLVGDAVVYFIRARKYKLRQQEYDFWFSSLERDIRLEPYYQFTTTAGLPEHVGIRFHYAISK